MAELEVTEQRAVEIAHALIAAAGPGSPEDILARLGAGVGIIIESLAIAGHADALAAEFGEFVKYVVRLRRLAAAKVAGSA